MIKGIVPGFISRRVQLLLLLLLVLINIMLRFPLTPHEIGWDSYFIHSLAQSINDNGMALWTIHPLSYFGMYPLSYPSAVPFLLSSISQVANINIETTILILSIMLGIISALAMFMLAGIIKKNVLFQFFVALIYSTSGGLLQYSTWTASTRGMLIALMPLFFYFYFAGISKVNQHMKGLAIIMLIILAATHRMFILALPLIILFPIASQIMKIKYQVLSLIKYSKRNVLKIISLLSVVSIIAVFTILFLSGLLNELYIDMIPSTIKGDPINLTIRAGAFIGRNIGLVAILSLFGIVAILLKKNKNFYDVYFILCSIALVPLLVVAQYILHVASLVFCILAGLFVFQCKTSYPSKHEKTIFSKLAVISVIIIIVGSISITAVYQIKSLNIYSEGDEDDARYIELSGYDSAMWLNIYDDGGVISNKESSVIARRVTAISAVPYFPGQQTERLINEYNSEEEINPVYRSPLTYKFYKYGVVEDLNGVASELQGLGKQIVRLPITDYHSQWAFKRYNIAYVINNNLVPYDESNPFIISVMAETYCVFNNEKATIYKL